MSAPITVPQPPAEKRSERMVRLQYGGERARSELLGMMAEADALGHMGAHLRLATALTSLEDALSEAERAERTFKDLEAQDDRWERHERGE